eukprot:CAMPEP_0202690952 /NCGR_PEP_ID=MMETSP1385-20130828/5809_1 /ASSEMBLY_ACC=CAM_ASM_000861 /TAXON_ID=933848 /ORGANISM="Elphidium margaritaceum" /LENGTH=693 /DNA_ID=CAMNT_0049346293 /DNA_START=27 /DNA_END=2108 /DNA_ORIENTATION=-
MSTFSSIFGASNDISSWWLDKDNGDVDDDDPLKGDENERDCSIFVIDCNEKMFSDALPASVKPEQSSSSELSQAASQSECIFGSVCHAIQKSLRRSIIKSKDDLVCVVLFNVLGTVNALQLPHLLLFAKPDCPSAKLIKSVRDLPHTFHLERQSLKDGKECDFRDLLWLLQSIFSEIDVKGTKFGSKRAFIFTNNDAPSHKDGASTAAKAMDMLDAGMEITVFPLKAHFELKRFYDKICTFDLDEVTTESQLHAQCPSLNDLENSLRVREMKKRSVVSCPLQIGADWRMAVKFFCVFRRATKESPVWLDSRTNQPLTTATDWVCSATGAKVDNFEQQVRTYHEYGPSKHRVYFTRAEMNELKSFGAPSLTLMGFKPLARLKPYYQVKPAQFIYPDEPRCIGSTVAFNALVQAMASLQQFAVCRYIARKNSGPRFVALVAQKEAKGVPNGMQMIFLPFADDIRKVEVKGQEDMKRCQPMDNAQHAILMNKCKNLIDRLVPTRYRDMADGEMEDEFPCNPVLQKHYDALEALALEQVDDAEHGGKQKQNPDHNQNSQDDNDDNDECMQDAFVDEIEPDQEEMEKIAAQELAELLAALDACDDIDDAKEAESKPKNSRKRAAADSGTGTKRKAQKKKSTDNPSSNAESLDWKKLAENDELNNLKVKDLKVYLSENSLKMTGRKAELVDRIKGHLGL